MKRVFCFVVAALMATSLGVVKGQGGPATAERLLASAQHKAAIDGDLRGAIDEYGKAFAAAAGNRALAARALVRMADCHQQLGNAEARAIYERVIREYADQDEAVALARTKLGGSTERAAVKGDRSVWTGDYADGFGTISPDGRYLSFIAWPDDAHLGLRDLATGTSYRLTPGLASGGSAQSSAISRDGKWVAYEWTENGTSNADRRTELRVARLHATSITESRRLFQNDEIVSVTPYDWSPDGRWLSCQLIRKDGTRQLGLVSVPDGALRVLKSLDWKKPMRVFFSPDGRFIGYDLMVSDISDERHVFVMATDGSQESVVAADASQNVMMGWSPDGEHLLFSSDRSGTFGLWAVSVSNGKAAEPPTLVKPDVASTWSLGVTPGGTMYVWKHASPVYLQVSGVDMPVGRIASGAPTFKRFITSRGRPDWSADGKHLAYQTCNPLGGGPCKLWIRSMDTGDLRELKPRLSYFGFMRWSPDGRELLTSGSDMKGRNLGIYRIDVQTGAVRKVDGGFRRPNIPQWAPDGAHLYYLRDAAIVEHDLDTGSEREVVRVETVGAENALVSPDGKTVAYEAEADGAREIFMMPLAGGMPRSVFRVTGQERRLSYHWTSEGRALVVAKYRADTELWQLWTVDAASGHARQLEIDVARWKIGDGFRFDPAGKQVAFVANAGATGQEIRALENFLPRRSAGTSARRK